MAARGQETSNVSVNVQDPFRNWTRRNLEDKANECLEESKLNRYRNDIVNGAYLAQDPEAELADESLAGDETRPTDPDKFDRRDLFRQPWRVYALISCCSLGALIQGWDESAVNGAQLYYVDEFPFTNRSVIKGLVNGAPYLCCVISCLLTGTLNDRFGRRNTIALTCLISFAFALGQALAENWKTLFALRILLGLGIGPKSATIPIYSAECVPKQIRGALVMQWQTWIAFGIMLGMIFNLAFADIGRNNWRFMIGSPMVAPLFLCVLLFSQPESPRWLLQQAFKKLERAGKPGEAHSDGLRRKAKRDFEDAYSSLNKLRDNNHLETGRDFFLMWYLLKDETTSSGTSSGLERTLDLLRKPRCCHAFVAGLTLMFLQQFCGVNTLAYYSSTVYKSARTSNKFALLFSMGFGIINFIFSAFAIWWIDRFGRRNLLLATFPLMGVFQLGVALSFLAGGHIRIVLVVIFSYLFAVAYSVGEGPVPFVGAPTSVTDRRDR
ncbi:MAG: hypothetical protein Q9225_004299 [Loekoesia sp. 1 TL-2023]